MAVDDTLFISLWSHSIFIKEADRSQRIGSVVRTARSKSAKKQLHGACVLDTNDTIGCKVVSKTDLLTNAVSITNDSVVSNKLVIIVIDLKI